MGLIINSPSGMDSGYYRKKRQAEIEHRGGASMSNEEFQREYYEKPNGNGGLSDSGTSVFDPVLCELQYAWYTREGDSILDPFAGGSVRGIVAAKMGRRYTGVELRPEQVEANVAQAEEICDALNPEWIVGDSAGIDELVPADGFDFMLTCPPYADLEVYSDDPADLSNMPLDGFIDAYRAIMAKAVAKLANDRFAVVVIGDARGKDGFYYNLPGITVQAMEEAGARYYNEAILITPVGSLPIRVGKQFTASRKLGKTHQNVLTFVKGDARKAAERIGDVALAELVESN